MKNIVIVVILGVNFSCSSKKIQEPSFGIPKEDSGVEHKTQNTLFENDRKESIVIEKSIKREKTEHVEIPLSFKKLQGLIEQGVNGGPQYEIIAYESAVDLVNAGNAALSSYNSPQALKLLTIGSQLLFWRSDVVSLKNKALNVYVLSTNDLVSDENTTCEYLFERMNYLSTVAPDALLKIKGFKQRCPNTMVKKDQYLVGENGKIASIDFLKYLETKPIEPDEIAEKKYMGSLENQLDFYIKRNKAGIPKRDIITIAFGMANSLYQDFKISCNDLKIDPNSISKKSLSILASCDLTACPKDNLNVRNFEKKTLHDLMYVPGGAVYWDGIQTTEPLLNNLNDITKYFGEFSEGYPEMLIVKQTNIYSDKSTVEYHLVKARFISGINQISWEYIDIDSIRSYEESSTFDLGYRFQNYEQGRIMGCGEGGERTGAYMRYKKRAYGFIQNLKSIATQIDLSSTYNMYQDLVLKAIEKKQDRFFFKELVKKKWKNYIPK